MPRRFTERAARGEENSTAGAVTPTGGQPGRIGALPPAAGDTHTEAQVRTLDR
ncbi:hypothetical protein ACF07B_07430 [Streptomyces sp. NPDC015532]|uniref:hypothetical protein n=1 Tax=Streptomyces sp. NPDC015532 TaxID=3364960 RepID=UPI0037012641